MTEIAGNEGLQPPPHQGDYIVTDRSDEDMQRIQMVVLNKGLPRSPIAAIIIQAIKENNWVENLVSRLLRRNTNAFSADVEVVFITAPPPLEEFNRQISELGTNIGGLRTFSVREEPSRHFLQAAIHNNEAATTHYPLVSQANNEAIQRAMGVLHDKELVSQRVMEMVSQFALMMEGKIPIQDEPAPNSAEHAKRVSASKPPSLPPSRT